MREFQRILVPLDGSATAARCLRCATWLAERLGARLHILSATDVPRTAREELVRLKVPEEHWTRIELHRVDALPEQAILETTECLDIDLLVMSARGCSADTTETSSRKLIGHVARAVIERSTVPVLLLPRDCDAGVPWTSALVPVSGELQSDEALAIAVGLGRTLGLDVVVAHVADERAGEDGLEGAARYPDAPHHEYPEQLSEFVRRALPHCAADDRSAIKDILLCRGEVAAELLKVVERLGISLLVVAWKGRFMTGHAQVLKELIEASGRPLLLIKAAARTPFRLKVGEDIP